MSFWDNVKKFAQPYSEDDYEEEEFEDEMPEFEEEAQQPASRTRRASAFSTQSAGSDYSAAPERSSGNFSGQVLNMSSGKQEVVLFHAKTFDDAAKAADELRKRRAVILNMENIDKTLTRRVVDFLSGSVYALDGSVKKVAQCTYLFCPHNMDVVGDLENIQGEADLYV